MCKVWDARTQKSTMAFDHGAPIESLAFFPSGAFRAAAVGPMLPSLTPPLLSLLGTRAESMLVTAGGAHLCCWDLFSGGKLLHKFAAHQKTVTSVVVQRVNPGPSSDGSLRILSASLDGHVKVSCSVSPIWLSYQLTPPCDFHPRFSIRRPSS